MKVVIVGAGIAGLTAARALHPRHDITVFERHAYAGGHTNTIELDGAPPLDTGFIVYNERTYPEFTRLLSELGVRSQPSEMSFSVSCARCGVEYAGRSARSVFAAGWRALRPAFLATLADIARFNRWASRLSADPAMAGLAGRTLAEVVAPRFSAGLMRHYLVPMTSAIWSGTVADAEAMPIEFLMAFYRNHGLLGVFGQPQWRTVTGGSRRYVDALVRPFRDRIRTGCPVVAIRRGERHVELRLGGGATVRADRVVIATHADEALVLLDDATAAERRLLTAIPFRTNRAILHTDAGVLPRRPVAWASWNYAMTDCQDRLAPLQMTYYLNRLQNLDGDATYCVTLNDQGTIPESRVLARIDYAHPVYTPEGLRARRELTLLGGHQRTYYCGAYLGYGFHEDGVRAGLDVARAIEREESGA